MFIFFKTTIKFSYKINIPDVDIMVLQFTNI